MEKGRRGEMGDIRKTGKEREGRKEEEKKKRERGKKRELFFPTQTIEHSPYWLWIV